MKNLLLCLCIICAGLQSYPQNPFARYKVEHYDSKNGMPNDFVMNTYQTKDGFMWMNSYSGYIRFDGKQFVNFNSNNTPVLKIDNSNSLFTESEDSTLWLPITGAGLIGYKKGVFTPYLTQYPSLSLLGKSKQSELILTPDGIDSTKGLIVLAVKSKLKQKRVRVRSLLFICPLHKQISNLRAERFAVPGFPAKSFFNP